MNQVILPSKGINLQELRQFYREKILNLAEKYGAYNIHIFGSVARGDNNDQSDLDFLVEFEKDRNLLDRIGLIQDLEELLGCKIDVAKIQNLHPDIQKQVLKEAVIL